MILNVDIHTIVNTVLNANNLTLTESNSSLIGVNKHLSVINKSTLDSKQNAVTYTINRVDELEVLGGNQSVNGAVHTRSLHNTHNPVNYLIFI